MIILTIVILLELATAAISMLQTKTASKTEENRFFAQKEFLSLTCTIGSVSEMMSNAEKSN